MIVTKSPLRITLGGGGTDLPSYYREHGGFVISAAIDKFVYVTITRPFAPGIFLKYSKLERAERAEDVQHPIFREALRARASDSPIEITTLADIPARTGLGSSGSFTTALLRAIAAFDGQPIEPRALAEAACDIEINKLGERTGKQDQYIAAFGGVTCFTFDRDDNVSVEPLALPNDVRGRLGDHLLLFFTGYSRSATSILAEQDDRTIRDDPAMVENLHEVKALGHRSRTLLESGDLEAYGRSLDEHWQRKKQRSACMSNAAIDGWYALAMTSGALGGKLVGAGGGGFLLFYADDPLRLREAMRGAGLDEVRFRFEDAGTRLCP